MSPQKLNSLAAFVLDNPSGLEVLEEEGFFDGQIAIAVLERVIRAGCPLSGLVGRIAHAPIEMVPQLFDWLVGRCRNDQEMFEVASALLTLEKTHQSNNKDERENREEIEYDEDSGISYVPKEWFVSVAKVVSRVRDWRTLFAKHREALLDDRFEDMIMPDAYWEHRVCWYLGKRDYCRAWDELVRAGRGFMTDPKDPNRLHRPDLVDYHFRASHELVTNLVRMLHQQMVERGILPPLPSGEFKLQEREAYTDVYETKKPCSHRRARHFRQYVKVAGLRFALQHFLISEGSGYFEKRVPDVFTVEGGMVLAIAEWRRREKNAKRREKFEKLATEAKIS